MTRATITPAELDLAADIRAVDGNHDLGAGALADALIARGWSKAAARQPAPDGLREALRIDLEDIASSGYQPTYNGRPSCPFCLNFVDNEETHTSDCVLVAALATEPSAES